MTPDQALLDAIEQDPCDLSRRLVYADWLEERGDSRGEYVRVSCALLTASDQDREVARHRKRLDNLAVGMEAKWLAFFSLQDKLYLVSSNCLRGQPVPPPLRVLWKQAITKTKGTGLVVGDPLPRHSSRCEIGLECKPDEFGARQEYLDNNPDSATAFRKMFAQIAFIGGDADGRSFGFWLHSKSIDVAHAPIICLNTDCYFSCNAPTLQDYFAVAEASYEAFRQHFDSVRKWFATRGVETLESVDAIRQAMTSVPNPEERFQEVERSK